jgi:hypothetical protein
VPHMILAREPMSIRSRSPANSEFGSLALLAKQAALELQTGRCSLCAHEFAASDRRTRD